MIVPHINTLNWIRNLGIALDDDWRPWSVDGQIAGYTERYKNKDFSITFATVKGGGHVAAAHYPKECLAMIERWFDLYPL
ncbi:serine carboxypeptidase-like 17 [Olea europaea var. sylvestris]|uniref:serine carboxypeptidase-like 17 n=1 Tax=Olea europaea var. sylvestris TaxID=158386 RepID=UPI000C1D39D7|nr:serine carboxypeptidase-like 17 [Olea europaea var. sylvestris]